VGGVVACPQGGVVVEMLNERQWMPTIHCLSQLVFSNQDLAAVVEQEDETAHYPIVLVVVVTVVVVTVDDDGCVGQLHLGWCVVDATMTLVCLHLQKHA
jgi:hypothetical protein